MFILSTNFIIFISNDESGILIRVSNTYTHHPSPTPSILLILQQRNQFYHLIDYNSFAQTCYVLDCFSSSSLSHIVSIMKCVHPIEQQT